LYAGGEFLNAGGVSAVNIAKWNGSFWTNLGSGMTGGALSSSVVSLVTDMAGNVYAGGSFTNAGGTEAANIAVWNGNAWSPVGSGVNATVDALFLGHDGNLLVGGMFTTAGTTASPYIAEAIVTTGSAILSFAQLDSVDYILKARVTPGYSYALDLATNLAPPVIWVPQTTNASSSQSLVFTNASFWPAAFYRARYVP
jgi:hypothetical protein